MVAYISKFWSFQDMKAKCFATSFYLFLGTYSCILSAELLYPPYLRLPKYTFEFMAVLAGRGIGNWIQGTLPLNYTPRCFYFLKQHLTKLPIWILRGVGIIEA